MSIQKSKIFVLMMGGPVGQKTDEQPVTDKAPDVTSDPAPGLEEKILKLMSSPEFFTILAKANAATSQEEYVKILSDYVRKSAVFREESQKEVTFQHVKTAVDELQEDELKMGLRLYCEEEDQLYMLCPNSPFKLAGTEGPLMDGTPYFNIVPIEE